MVRNPLAVRARIMQTLVMSLITLCVFWQINGTDLQARYNVAGASFFICVYNTMNPLMGTIGLFQMERPVFLREQANRMYSVFIYFQTKTMTELPFNLLVPLIYCVIVYFAQGLNPSFESFITFYLILSALIQVNLAMGYMLSSVFHDFAVANMMGPTFMMPLILFSGFYANANTIPSWLAWFSYLAPPKYAFEAIMVNEYEGNETDQGFDILEMLGFKIGKWKCIFILLGMAVFYRMVAVFALKNLITKFS